VSDDNVGGYIFRGNFLLPAKDYKYREGTSHLVVHCSATKAHQDFGVDDIREWHVKDNGWLDVGYNFVIKRDGVIERGRPAMAVGSGVAGYNSHSLHVCLIGGIDNDGNAEDNFTDAQRKSLAFLLASLNKYVAPKAEVCGHRDFPGVQKACPSFDAKAWWKAVSSTEASANPPFMRLVRMDTFLN
jgi:N-acetylmuramoyl-L-alanine amidase